MTKEEIRTLEKIRKEMESWIEKIDAMLEGSEEDTEDIAETAGKRARNCRIPYETWYAYQC